MMVELNPRDIMDRPVTRRDHAHDFGKPHNAAVAEVERASRPIAARHHREASGPEEWTVSVVKRTVDKVRVPG
jgi:hypothetical protein